MDTGIKSKAFQFSLVLISLLPPILIALYVYFEINYALSFISSGLPLRLPVNPILGMAIIAFGIAVAVTPLYLQFCIIGSSSIKKILPFIPLTGLILWICRIIVGLFLLSLSTPSDYYSWVDSNDLPMKYLQGHYYDFFLGSAFLISFLVTYAATKLPWGISTKKKHSYFG